MNNPKLRFKGYTEDWEQRKLGDMYVPLNERNEDLLPYSKTLSVATMAYKEVGNGAADSSLSNYKRLRLGDIAFEGHTSKEFRYGRFVLNDAGDGIMSPRFSALRPISELPVQFWKYYIHYEPIMRKVLVNSTKAGTMMNELVVHEFLQESILVPSVTEQQLIGQYFSTLDRLITLHQRKCEQAKKLKKYMLQKMFPKNGESVPEIRFSGFTDAWEQRKLGKVTKEFKSGNSLKADEIDENGEYPVYGGNGLRGYTSTYNHDGEFALIGRQGALCGNMNYSLGKAYFTEHAVAVKADKENDTRFIYYMLDTMNLGQYSDQSAQPGLAVNKLIKLENMFPKKEEQVKIGSYFCALDTLITLHQRECEKLQNMKKYMLQNMFV